MRENDTVALKPANLSYEEAATVPYGALMALGLLKEGKIQRGQKVLINGASGGMGSYAVQLAKHYGAEVTGVCGTPRLEFVKALGADHVIDYTQEDFTQNGETYDLIFDVLGRSSFARSKKSLTPTGRVSVCQLQDQTASANAVDIDHRTAKARDLRDDQRQARHADRGQKLVEAGDAQNDCGSLLSDGAGRRCSSLCRGWA